MEVTSNFGFNPISEKEKCFIAQFMTYFLCNLINLSFISDDDNDRKSIRVLNELENIDDECDNLGVTFVKIDNSDEAKEYGIEKLPALVYFEKGIPLMYNGTLLLMPENVRLFLMHEV